MKLIIQINDEWARAIEQAGPAARLEVGGFFGFVADARIVTVLPDNDFHWPAWCPHGDGYHQAASPALKAAQRRAENQGSYGSQQEVQAMIHEAMSMAAGQP